MFYYLCKGSKNKGKATEGLVQQGLWRQEGLHANLKFCLPHRRLSRVDRTTSRQPTRTQSPEPLAKSISHFGEKRVTLQKLMYSCGVAPNVKTKVNHPSG